jgi:hypothetical protein
MYRHGFGDCFLLKFMSNETPVYRMLIDCGMLTGSTELLKECIINIKEECNGRLDLVVLTHEHKDHISGINLKDDNKKLLWDSIGVDNVWFAWTENTDPGGDKLAIELKKKFNKKKQALAKALQVYEKGINTPAHQEMLELQSNGKEYLAAQHRYAEALQGLLNFYDMGADDGQALSAARLTMKDAMAYFRKRGKNKETPHISYWDPGDLADVSQTGIEGVRFYFLGPPKNYDLLRKMDDNEHVEMYLTGMELSDNFYLALSEADDNAVSDSPFHSKYVLSKKELGRRKLSDDHVWQLYHGKEEAWRRVSMDWLHNAGILALHLDSYTNNTSLVIAIEFEESGKVLLFPADAQIGNWISWTEPEAEGNPTPKLKWEVESQNSNTTVTATDLLERTVFYKVGHHASHNATAKKHGLELMTSKELAAMITVDEEVAKRQGKHGWKMPADELYQRLLEKTRGRIIRIDKGNILKKGTTGIPSGAKPSQRQRQAFNKLVTESDIILDTNEGKRPMYVEYRVKG